MRNARAATVREDPATTSASLEPGAPRLCVIGAGMSGLAAVDAFIRAGFEVTCYEAGSAVGGMWRYENDSGRSAAYASLETNTSKRRMQYPSFPQPESAPEFPRHSDMLAYLVAYSEANELTPHVRFRAVVQSAEPTDGGWSVTVAGEPPREFDWLVVATGHYWEPIVPRLSGAFTGETLHVRDYRTPEGFAGKRVVVVGGSQSALDIAAEIATVAASVTLACDRVHHLLPRYAFGRPLDERDTATALLVPLPAVRLLVRAITRVAGTAPERGELPPPGHPLLKTRWPIIVSPPVEAALRGRTFACRPRVTQLDGETVRFADGTDARADSIVFATGYEIGFPFLAAGPSRGSGWEFPLYRRIVSPHAQRLAFIGVVEAGPGMFEIVERQSQWLVRFIAGHLEAPARGEMWQAIDAGERRSRRQFSSTGPHTIMCNRHAYLRLLERDLRRARTQARPSARPSPGRRLPAAVAGARLQARTLRGAGLAVASAPAAGELDGIARARHALLVTYRRDGTPVATPVWAALAGGRVYVRTERTSGKVRRLRNDPRALLAPCSARGRPLGPALRVSGRLLGARDERVAETALASRYGRGRALFERAADAMLIDMAYLELTPRRAPDGDGGAARVAARTSAAVTS